MTANVPSLLLFIMSTNLSKHAWHYLPNGGKDELRHNCCLLWRSYGAFSFWTAARLRITAVDLNGFSTSMCSSIISSLPFRLISQSDLYSPCCHMWRWCKLNCIFSASVLFSFLKRSWFVFRLKHLSNFL